MTSLIDIISVKVLGGGLNGKVPIVRLALTLTNIVIIIRNIKVSTIEKNFLLLQNTITTTLTPLVAIMRVFE